MSPDEMERRIKKLEDQRVVLLIGFAAVLVLWLLGPWGLQAVNMFFGHC